MAFALDPDFVRSQVWLHRERDRIRAARIRAARVDPASFCEYVLRDERTGRGIKLAPVHVAWHALMSAHPRLVMWSSPDAGKTHQCAIGRVLWELGKNPSLRIVIFSATQEMAKKIISTIRQYIERSAELKDVFPALRATPHKAGQPWSMLALTVERAVISKDPSVQATGLRGNILGSRVDLLLFDDVCTAGNTRTEEQLEETFRLVTGTPFGRLTDGARVWSITNAWHPKDSNERLVDERGFHGARFPVVDSSGRPSWPERFTPARLHQLRADLGSHEFTRQMLCVPRDDSSARFKREWIDRGIARGEGFELVSRVDALPNGFAIFTGVDLAVSKNASADLTVFFTLLLHPDGSRQVLNIESGRWSGPEIVRRIEETTERYGGLIVVENNAAQDFILQFARQLTRAQLKAFTTGNNKADPAFGIESLATEMEAGWWIVPAPAGVGAALPPEVEAWVREMTGYDPKRHTGDRLMASWFAREGARQFERAHHRKRSAQKTLSAAPAPPANDDLAPARAAE